MITKEQIAEIRKNIPGKTVGIIGDFCVDIYWEADMTKSELSRETPNFPLPIVKERIYAGAGGNVACNVAALAPAKIYALCLTGCDWRADSLKRVLKQNGISDELVISSESLVTNAYCKPMKHGISGTVYEDPRLDFENRQPLDEQTEAVVLEKLDILLEKADIIICADQFRYGIVTDKVRDKLCEAAKNGKTVICDSRYNIGKYANCILKPNEVECYKAVYNDNGYLAADSEKFLECARALSKKAGSVVFCTLGDKGSMIVNGDEITKVSAFKVEGPLDICGAGDTSISAFSCAIASGADFETAAGFAGAASAVTIQKVGVTGTASFDEILNIIDKEEK